MNNRSDRQRRDSLQDGEPMLYFIYKGEPLTKSNNTFFARGHAYIPKKQKEYQEGLADAARTAMNENQPLSDLIRMEVWYYMGSKRRKDLVNLPKTTTDALNKICYDDDSQIHELILHRCIDRINPRVEIAIWRIEDPIWENN
jgi:Holliday junction resolvase RusA-like endonuclease